MCILTHILDFASPDEEFYFLKLEALWTLINLSMCDTDDIKLILMSEFPIDPSEEIIIDTDFVARDFKECKSDIIAKLEGFLKFTL